MTTKNGNTKALAAAVLLLALFVALLLAPRVGVAQGSDDGIASPDIVGGQLASDGEWPWQVALVVAGADPYDGQFCGGSLIAPGWVLTAAHCVVDNGSVTAPGSIQILAGIHSLRPADAGYQRINIQQIIVHPNYEEDTYNEDAALLRLATDAVLGPTAGGQVVGVVQLVAADVGDLVGQMADITGWGNTGSGYPTQLYEARVPVVSQADCNDANSYNGDITDNMLCAGYTEGGIDTCQGDSGGPLVVGGPGNFRLAGITSWGQGCALPNKPGVYTRVSRYVAWVNSYVNPTPAPTITSFTPTSGNVGTTVTVNGTNLTGATAVRFNNVKATTFSVASATRLTAVVPTGATTGKISVITPGGTATSATNFTVTGVPVTYRAFLPMSTHQPPPAPGLLPNGGFEQGPTVWVQSSSNGWPLILERTDLPIDPHGGNWAAWLGGDDNELSTLRQQVTISAARPYLAYYHNIGSQDVCGRDFARVRINNTVVDQVDLCLATEISGWESHGVNLSAYAGRVVTLQFEVRTDNNNSSGYLIDDISFTTVPSLINGNFDQGPGVGWSESSSSGFDLLYNAADLMDEVGLAPHSGSWAVWLGGADGELSRLSQNVTIPAGTPYLSYYHWIASADACNFDFARIWFGATKVSEFSLCNSANTGGWVRRTVNLSAFAGQTRALVFEAETDGSGNSNWFVDTVSLGASGRDEAPALPAPVSPALLLAEKSFGEPAAPVRPDVSRR